MRINLGIDFGTSFTKVCFRNVGAERSGIVDFSVGAHSQLEETFIPSIASIGPSGELVVGRAHDTWKSLTGDGFTEVRHLKIRLAELDLSDQMSQFRLTSLPNELDPLGVENLATIFLANVILESKAWLSTHRPDLFEGVEVKWTANVGVPVKIYDSPAIERFRRVLAQAWMMAGSRHSPIETVEDAVDALNSTDPIAEDDLVDFHAYPEIIAAVQSLVLSPSAREAIYIYFDVGGGTLDGISFRFRRTDEGPRVSVYWGEIEPLGVEAIIGRHPNFSPEVILQNLQSEDLNPDLSAELDGEVGAIQSLVAPVVVQAKKKDPLEWKINAQLGNWYDRYKAKVKNVEKIKLGVFLGGGGGNSPFYQKAVLSTYDDFNHANAGIPRYELAEIPQPDDLDMGNVPKSDGHRFHVAYGLSIPMGEGPEIKLPREFDELSPTPPRPLEPIGTYEN